MALFHRSTIPNAITVARIIAAPIVFLLIFDPDFTPRLVAFILFLAAAFSDLWDGYLARKYGWISNFGKLVDPIADKLLLIVTFIPFYVLSHRGDEFTRYPFWPYLLPLWAVIVVFGREVLITVIRTYAAKHGTVIPAGSAGKRKAVWQNVFIGTTIFWYAIHSAAAERNWQGSVWHGWRIFHGITLSVTFILAVGLTIYSLVVYLWNWRAQLRQLP